MYYIVLYYVWLSALNELVFYTVPAEADGLQGYTVLAEANSLLGYKGYREGVHFGAGSSSKEWCPDPISTY